MAHPAVSAVSSENPYRSPLSDSRHNAALGRMVVDGARSTLLSSGLLFRRIAIEAPVEFEIEFNGRGLRDVVLVDRRPATSRISWWQITPEFRFLLSTTQGEIPVRVRLKIGRFFRIKGFEVEIDGRAVNREGVYSPQDPTPLDSAT